MKIISPFHGPTLVNNKLDSKKNNYINLDRLNLNSSNNNLLVLLIDLIT